MSPTCSVELFSAVLGRLEDRGLSEVSEREEGLLEGTGDSGWWRSEWPDTAASAEKNKIKSSSVVALWYLKSSAFASCSNRCSVLKAYWPLPRYTDIEIL